MALETRVAPAPPASAPGVAGKLSGLSVIVTAYNEEGSIEAVVEAVRASASVIAEKLEIIVIDDGSRDATPAIANSLAAKHAEVRVIHHPFNIGFGGAQKSGFLHASHEWITLVPGDNQFDPRDLERFLSLANDSDIVVGYRVKRGDSRMRRLNTRVFRFVMRLLFGVTLRDVNWVKLFRKTIVDGLDLEFRGIGIDAEIVVKAARRGCRFSELEVGYHPRRTGVSTGDKFVNVIITVLELLWLWWTAGRTPRR
ncbi:MAG: glycosyltransferase family 2 protein [Planctomycetes bacterium]|nr:glycosyltransferase family 2 protein [Planctomycetota bacterium]